MKYRTHVLCTSVQGFVQRRDHQILRRDLVPKYEHILFVRLTPWQEQLYMAVSWCAGQTILVFTDSFYWQLLDNILEKRTGSGLFELFSMATRIWNHPDLLFNAWQRSLAALSKTKAVKLDADPWAWLFGEKPKEETKEPLVAEPQSPFAWVAPFFENYKPGTYEAQGGFFVHMVY
jgi:hypothetical protein